MCSECGKPLHAREVHTHPGPGAKSAAASAAAKASARKTPARKAARAS